MRTETAHEELLPSCGGLFCLREFSPAYDKRGEIPEEIRLALIVVKSHDGKIVLRKGNEAKNISVDDGL